MAQTEAQKREAAKARKAAQRKTAAAIKRNENPLGGEFRKQTQQALGHEYTPPPPIAPTIIDVEPPEDSIDYYDEGDYFARGIGTGEGADQEIPLTYFPTATSYPSRLPQNKHPRTRAAGYNRLTRTLAVQFWTPANLYHYYEVPPYMAREFRLADSPGDFINDYLNRHPYEKIY